MSDLFLKAHELESRHVPFAIITLLEKRGHVPQEIGAKALVTTEHGLVVGTIGGGRLEATALADALELLSQKKSGVHFFKKNLPLDLKMTCGGEADYLVEVFGGSKWQIVICGGGHVGQALVRALAPLSAELFLIEDRPEWVQKAREATTPGRVQFCESLEKAFPSILPEAASFVVVTPGHQLDFEAACFILKRVKDPVYLGIVGSRVKSLKLKNDLKQQGFSDQVVDKIRCPMGLSLGKNLPEEMVFSIGAELIKVRDELEARGLAEPDLR